MDQDDHTKIKAVIDWDFTQVWPVWFAGYNYARDFFPRIRLGITPGIHNDLWAIRNNVLEEQIPELIWAQREYRHLETLFEAAWNPHHAVHELIVSTIERLIHFWPEEESSNIETLRCFLQTLNE